MKSDVPPAEPPQRQDEGARRVYITAKDFEEHGHTEGCKGCKWAQTKMAGNRPHSEECRARMEAAMKQTEDGKGRLKRAQDRMDHAIAEKMEKKFGKVDAERRAAQQAEEKEAQEQQAQGKQQQQPGQAESEEDQNTGGASSSSSSAPAATRKAEEPEDQRELKKAKPPLGPRTQEGQKRESEEDQRELKKAKPPLGPRTQEGQKREGAEADSGRPTTAQRLQGMQSSAAQGLAAQGFAAQGLAAQGFAAQGLAAQGFPAQGSWGMPHPRDAGIQRPNSTPICQVLERMAADRVLGVDVAEVYSPERVAKMAEKMGLRGGLSMDLTTGWDFNREAHRKTAIEYVTKEKPKLLIGSPMCTMFSQLQHLNWGRSEERDQEMQRRYENAVEHMKFVAKLYKLQLDGGRYFLHEHPQGASSWDLQCMRDITGMERVLKVTAHMCAFGLVSDRNGEQMLVKKATTFATNSPHIAHALGQQCSRDHPHAHLLAGRAGPAARYTDALCRAICEGLVAQQRNDRTGLMMIGAVSNTQVRNATRGLQNPEWKDGHHEEESVKHNMVAYDDVTGAPLEVEKVKEARKVEMEFFRNREVYKKVHKDVCEAAGMKPIPTRWVDVNKGDNDRPDYRSRLVAKEYRSDSRPELYAATPPLEALRAILSQAATLRRGGEPRCIMVNDIKRAYFYARARRPVFIIIPEEDREEGDENMVGELNLSMYGTRDAAQNWQETFAAHLVGLGFTQGVSNPCLFYHRAKDIKTMVHGDDYVSAASQKELEWLRGELDKKFETKSTIIGPKEGQGKEVKVLNRVIRMTEKGVEHEADQRHAEIIVENMGMKDSKGVATPGTRDDSEQDEEENEEELTGTEATMFRAISARANYLALDRPDIQYATKEICRKMSKPRKKDWRRLARLAKYLAKRPRLVSVYKWQEQTDFVDVYTDANWAGCTETRKSTSGGAAMCGLHCLRTWSKTQATIALSSGESELFGTVKATCEGIGMASMLADLGIVAKIRVFADASAALAIIHRKGVGKVRHLDTGVLWLQQKELQEAVEFLKVAGMKNPSDLMTKNVDQALAEQHLSALGFTFADGRAESTAKICQLCDKSALV